MSAKQNLYKKTVTSLIIAAITVLLVVALDFFLTLAGFGPEAPPELAGQYDKFRPDKDLIWGLKKSWKGFELNNAPVTTNSLGMRGPEITKRGGYPVLFLGDSVIFGHYLPDDQTVPARLEAGVQQYTNPDVIILNGGVPGYSTFQMEKYYRLIGREVRPNLVLLGFCLNDVTERYLALQEHGGEKFFMINVDTTIHLSGVRKLWLNSAIRGAIVRLIKTSSKKIEIYNVKNLWRDPDSADIEEAWNKVFSEFDRLVEVLQKDGVELAVVIFPYRVQMEKSGLRIPQDNLITYLESKKIKYLDMLPVYLSEKFSPDQIFMDDNHLSPLGADMTAFHIHKFFIENNIVPVNKPDAPH